MQRRSLGFPLIGSRVLPGLNLIVRPADLPLDAQPTEQPRNGLANGAVRRRTWRALACPQDANSTIDEMALGAALPFGRGCLPPL
jgi:hypothetical protein